MSGKISAAKRVAMVGVRQFGMMGLAQLLSDWNKEVEFFDLPDELVELSHPDYILAQRYEALAPDQFDLLICGADLLASDGELGRKLNEWQRFGKIISYPEAVAELLDGQFSIVAAGSYGQTAAAAMVGQMLTELELDFTPSVLLSAAGNDYQRQGWGNDPHLLVAEVDETMPGIDNYQPRIMLINSCDYCHQGYYDERAYLNMFGRLIRRTLHNDGLVVANMDHLFLAELAGAYPDRFITFGYNPRAQWRVRHPRTEGRTTRFEVTYNEQSYHFKLNLPAHYLMSAVGAIAACYTACRFLWPMGQAWSIKLSLPGEYDLTGQTRVIGNLGQLLAKFSGVKDLDQPLGLWQGQSFCASKIHHPIEIRSAIKTARTLHPNSRLTIIFQPAQDWQSEHFIEKCASQLRMADEVVLLPPDLNRRDSVFPSRLGFLKSQLEEDLVVNISSIDQLPMRLDYLPQHGVVLILTGVDALAIWHQLKQSVDQSAQKKTPSLGIRASGSRRSDYVQA